MIPSQEWYPQASTLLIGERKLVAHSCGDRPSMLISRNLQGFSAHCFRCHESAWMAGEPLSLQERLENLAKLKDQDHTISSSIILPAPKCYDPTTWDAEAALWFYQAGMSNVDIQKLGAYYHEATNRVVIPVMVDDECIYWQARGFNPKQAKYINPSVPKGSVIPVYGTGNFIVLTEDLLSAYRVGLHTEAWCLLGTTLHDSILTALLQSNKPVYVWLDSDKAGRDGARKAIRRLSGFGVETRNICTEKDPKLLSRKEVMRELGLDPASNIEAQREV